MTDKTEPLLQNNYNKYSIFPITFHDVWDAYLTQQSSMWFDSNVDLSHDLKDWEKLEESERYFIKHILAFFLTSDGIIMENLASRFFNECQIAEVRSFYSLQIFMENIHSIMYGKLVETYFKDENEKIEVFNAVEQIPIIKEKADWAKKWISSSESFATRLVAFAVVEGIFFSGSFCSIYWINEKKIMPGLTESNSYIARDENLHCLFAVLLYTKYINNKLDSETIYKIVEEALDIETRFITTALPCSLLGMNSQLMAQYIKFCADRLIVQLGYKKLYNVDNPFPFMDAINLTTSSNFFDVRSTDYRKGVMKNKHDEVMNERATGDELFDVDF